MPMQLFRFEAVDRTQSLNHRVQISTNDDSSILVASIDKLDRSSNLLSGHYLSRINENASRLSIGTWEFYKSDHPKLLLEEPRLPRVEAA